MADFQLHISGTLGLLLGVCLAAGVFADLLHLPKVTAYLLVGLLVGPSLLDLVPIDHVHIFEPILKLAMALVLFNLGCEFTFAKFRRIARRCLILSAAEIFATFSLVTLGLLVFGAPASMAILLGCLAVATAPATTILVLKEFRSEGPITEKTGFLVAMNNLACILLFEFGFLFIQMKQGGAASSFLSQAGIVVTDIVGSMVLGVVGGLVISYGCGFLNSKRWLVLLVATVTFLLGIDESLHVPYMLTFFVMGVTVANTSDYKAKIVDELDHLSGLLAVLFFAAHGTELDAKAFVAAGALGVVYIVSRILGKWLGIYVAAKLTNQSNEVRVWLGGCLFAQAGAAIALSTIAVERNPELGLPIQAIILGSVVLFEIIGPLFIRKSLIETGEVPLAQAIHHTSRTPVQQFQAVVDRFRAAVRNAEHTVDAETVTTSRVKVSDLIRKTKGIPQSANFDDVIDHIEHSHDNTYPVVDDRMGVVGVIRYPLLSDVMFDHSASQLVRAEDLVSESNAILHPDDPAARAFELFQNETDDCIPVVTRVEPMELLGVVRRSDVMHALITQRRKRK
ncbi:cation:proton antiporter [Rubripirellula amarantea]|uniref:Putative voltage-gated ClC-type chloride channel ClcB n=1 Tax=Rubripirellula amarantea TaxID=2527999 RepID=A0A5C5WVM8_9BACT|nr:cation:proton antiporter [Rubripirellula amarantea]MDA8743729.1 cation:proton antiporter [Rubripirellula amarantea]TWT54600.1 putative voltage-gated ClC-type chloride channel ClcB [Rubripirellula amarantea]